VDELELFMENVFNMIAALAAAGCASLFQFGFWGLIAFVIYKSLTHRQKSLQVWRKLADAHGFTFTTSGFLGMPRVTGLYQGHPLTLETFSKGSGRSRKTYTRLLLSANPAGEEGSPLTSEDILNLSLTPADLEKLFIPANFSLGSGQEIEAAPAGRTISYEKYGLETDLQRLEYLMGWLSYLLKTYPALIALGGEAISTLQALAAAHNPIHPLLHRLIRDIAQETTARLGQHKDHLFCATCLTCCDAISVDLGWWQTAVFHGCRTCGQSRQFLEGMVAVAVLDNQTTTELSQQHGALYVNWLLRRELFDFSEIHLIQASDEDVERFAVQVGNDTDPVRKPRYDEMRCTIAPGCELSPNTLRILEKMFAEVVRQGETQSETQRMDAALGAES
jgi:hypothetical protein